MRITSLLLKPPPSAFVAARCTFSELENQANFSPEKKKRQKEIISNFIREGTCETAPYRDGALTTLLSKDLVACISPYHDQFSVKMTCQLQFEMPTSYRVSATDFSTVMFRNFFGNCCLFICCGY
ncbi:hypothetical protein AVEN_182499-1 [Araneus ventricosus]|uniref:Uncharacterized protein n=1 Tax=Araneus ventricosus TaxID=182803 RepID=A0A4Y2BXH9_ARAVE|nr:hypothetical protein AVEN_182499-1 [Araneus ventricosus]